MSKDNLMLDLVLKSEWFDKIKSGEKTVEYRELKPYWQKRIYPLLNLSSFPEDMLKDFLNIKKEETNLIYCFYPGFGLKRGAKVHFSRGYMRHEQMLFMIDEIRIMNGKNTDLHVNELIFAIHLGERIY